MYQIYKYVLTTNIKEKQIPAVFAIENAFHSNSNHSCINRSSNMLFLLIVSLLATLGVEADVQFEIINREPGPVWIGVQGNPGHPHLHRGGFSLNQGQSVTLSAPDNWAGRFWGRTWCDPQSNHCMTGDCGNKLECNGAGGVPPATLIEITLKGWGGLDYYDMSLVDGFNIRAFIEPVGQSGSGYSCTRATCLSDIDSMCPDELKIKHDGFTIACNSACNQFKTDEYCCRGQYNTAETCKSSTWPVDYPGFFKRECPDAYSYAFDDHKSTFTCKSSHYRIQFGA